MPVTDLQQRDFVVFENGQRLFSEDGENPWRIFNVSSGFDLTTLFLLDISASVLESEAGIEAVRNAAIEAAALLVGHRVSIAAFDGAPATVIVAPFDRNTEAARLTNLQTYSRDPGSTNLHGAILSGLGMLDHQQSLNAQRGSTIFSGSLIIFTDGTDQAGVVARDQAIEAAQRSPHRVFTIGLGDRVDEPLLRLVGKSGFTQANTVADLGSNFVRIARLVQSHSEKFYGFAYCTPKRAGSGVHTIAITVNGRSEALFFDFPATNFRGGCDLDAVAQEIGF